MRARNSIVFAIDDAALSTALGCCSETVEALQNEWVLESQGQFREVGPARDYLRDAAWADTMWH